MRRGGWSAVLVLILAQAAAHIAIGAETGAVANAAMNGDLPVMYALLRSSADANARGYFGTPPLHWRVRVDDLEAVKRLIPELGLRLGRQHPLADPRQWRRQHQCPDAIRVGAGWNRVGH